MLMIVIIEAKKLATHQFPDIIITEILPNRQDNSKYLNINGAGKLI